MLELTVNMMPNLESVSSGQMTLTVDFQKLKI